MGDEFRITLEAARVNANMTMDEACKALEISKTTLWNWENGKTVPTAEKAEKMAGLYKIPINRINFCRKSTI